MEVEGQLPFALQMGLKAITGGHHGFAVLLAVIRGGGVAGEQLLKRSWALILVGSPTSVQCLLERQQELCGGLFSVSNGQSIGAYWKADGPAVSEAIAAITDAEGDLEGVGLEALETEAVWA